MTNGTVRWFNTIKSNGVIAPHGGGRDVLFHLDALTRVETGSLLAGQKVSYELTPDGQLDKVSVVNLTAIT